VSQRDSRKSCCSCHNRWPRPEVKRTVEMITGPSSQPVSGLVHPPLQCLKSGKGGIGILSRSLEMLGPLLRCFNSGSVFISPLLLFFGHKYPQPPLQPLPSFSHTFLHTSNSSLRAHFRIISPSHPLTDRNTQSRSTRDESILIP
jgi:hypothetical protein